MGWRELSCAELTVYQEKALCVNERGLSALSGREISEISLLLERRVFDIPRYFHPAAIQRLEE